MKRIYRFLRSPRLALWLLAGIAGYAVLASLVPQKFTNAARAAKWAAENPLAARIAGAVGMDNAFASPVFGAAVALLCASTIACAIARTRSARATLSSGEMSRSAVSRLEAQPQFVLGPVEPEVRERVIAHVADGFSAAGYRVRSGPRLLEATKSLWGALGSPVFHWSLALLLVVVALGRLTRAEGMLVIPVGGRVIDTAASYDGRVGEGPLFAGHTGLEFGAEELRLNTVIGGIEQGPTAAIVLSRDGTQVARRRVYPNSPLRYGSLLVHRSDQWGYAPLISVETTAGDAIAQTYAHILSTAQGADAFGPAELELTGAPGRAAVLAVSIPFSGEDPDGTNASTRLLRMTLRRSGEPSSAPVLVAQGESIPFDSDVVIRYVKPGYFVTVNVANDWSVPWIYGLFALAAIGLLVAVLVPPRRVWVLTVERDGVLYLHVRSRHSRGDPNFPEYASGIIEQAIGESTEVSE